MSDAGRFDWYQATLRDEHAAGHPEAWIALFSEQLGCPSWDGTTDHGRWGYGARAVVRDRDGNVAVSVFYGGSQAWPSVSGTGAAAPAVARALRGHGWPHTVTRADVCLDWDQMGAWDRLFPICRDLSDRRHLAQKCIGDWLRAETGRTFQIGGKGSTVVARLYEKGYEREANGVSGASKDWVRLEIEVHPPKLPAQTLAARMEPGEFWGMSPWARELLGLVQGVDVPRVHLHESSRGDDSRALATLVYQYGGTLGRLRQRLGSDEEVGRWLMARIMEDEIAI